MITLPAVQAPNGQYDCVIDGTVYKFRFLYYPRLDAWYGDLRDSDGAPIMAGQRLCPGFPIWDYAATGAPTGRFFVVDLTGANPATVTREAFGDPIVIVYMTAAEVAANPAQTPYPPAVVTVTS